MSKELTADYNSKKLKKGWYWVRFNCYVNIEPSFYEKGYFWDDGKVEEVISPCDYNHFVELTEKAKKYDKIKINGNYPDKISKLKSRIKHLLELQANQDKEVENLRRLLKECKNIVAHDCWQEAQFPDGQVVERQELLTRITTAIGESEEK